MSFWQTLVLSITLLVVSAFLVWFLTRGDRGYRVRKKKAEVGGEVGPFKFRVSRTIEYFNQLPEASDETKTRLFKQGTQYMRKHQASEAIAAFKQYLALDVTPNERIALHLLIGSRLLEEMRFDEAEERYREAERLAHEVKNQKALATALNNIGILLRIKRELPKALEHHRQAMNIFKNIGDREGEAATRSDIGTVYGLLREPDKAMNQHEKAFTMHTRINNKLGAATDLTNMSLILNMIGDSYKALNQLQTAYSMFDEIGEKWGLGRTIAMIGITYSYMNKWADALQYYERALPILREVRDRQAEGAINAHMGIAHAHRPGELGDALEHYKEALSILREVRDKEGEAGVLANMGIVYEAMGEQGIALKLYEQSLELSSAIGYEEGIESAASILQAVKQERAIKKNTDDD